MEQHPTKRLMVPVNEACALIGVGRTLFYQLVNEGKIKTVQIGKRRLVVYSSLEALANGEAADAT